MEIDDFPDPEELQWLENNNSNLHDDFDIDLDCLQPPSPPSEPEPPESPEPESEPEPEEPELPPSKPTLSIPSKPTSIKPKLEINPKKRLLYDVGSHLSESGTLRNVGEDKRSRVDDMNGEKGPKKGDDDDDEDWLRYSLPLPDRRDADVAVVEQEKVLWRYAAEIEGDFVPVTGLDGERVYARICGVEKEEKVKKFDIKGNSEGLTLEPIRVLMQRVEQDELSKALQASGEGESQVTYSEETVNQEQLWVDKYAPNSFKELLSDEQTNREVLLWLKQWDSCVFGSEIKSTEDDVLSSLKRHSLGSQQSKSYSKNFFRNNRETVFTKGTPRTHNYQNQDKNSSKDIPELWEKQRRQSSPPEEKILLLCGPPGLGKTTLAHVAAKHCGYRVVEINASDDRSSSTIEAKILDVVQMNSVMADSKPKCLIIDEIDGALGDGKGAVEVILKMSYVFEEVLDWNLVQLSVIKYHIKLKMVSTEKKTTVGQEIIAQGEHSGRRPSKKKHSKTSLLRPVICICNDLYAPALRPLRQVAKVHIFVQPTVNRVVKRLKYICNKEGVRTSSIALTALTEYTECDIRSCLNTLQFLNKKKEALNMMEISSQVVGRKDASRSAFDIWKEIFQERKSKREKKSFCSSTNKHNEFEFLLSLISNRGDYDLIFDGIHENILRLHYYDPMMQKTVKCLENLEISDIINKYIMRTQHMSLQVYQPTIAIGIHGMVAQIARPVIEWPKSFQRYRSILLEKLDILRLWHNRIAPYISRHLSAKSFVEESISSFLHILSPPTMKPVAPHLLSEKEKMLLAQLIDTMVSYAVTYKNLKPGPSPGGQRHDDLSDVLLLSYDPPIDDFISFKGYTSCHFVLASAVKQLLAHEVEKQRILRSSINRCPSLADVNNENYALSVKNNISQSSRSYCTGVSSKQISADNFSGQGQQQSLSLPKPSILELQKGATTEEKVRLSEKRKKVSGGSFSFFDRFKKVCNNGSKNVNPDIQKSGTMERDMRPLLFKFNEGFTNAVKRPVKIREFLL